MRPVWLLGVLAAIEPHLRLVSAQNSSTASNETFTKEVDQNYFLVNSAFGILRSELPAQTLELPVGTCNDETPCINGACCSKISGLCGYSPSECGAGNCSSNCEAKAECGQYGRPGKQSCPLGVCCSQFGFCGSTSEFCDKGCQGGFGGCGDVKRPSCSLNGGSVEGRNIGYYESWANTRKCSAVSPEDLNLHGFTHLNFAFVFFDPNTFDIVPMDKNAGELLHRFTKLKEKKSGLQTWVSVGGWSFNDPGPYQQAFSNMASTAANRRQFIANLMRFMGTYGFDGVDLDWEYPTADDRGGKAEDSANFVLLSQDIKDAFGGQYGYTITLPASYWYLQHFDLAEHQKSVDWFNLMSYDLHGVWDAASKFIGPKIAPHTNITEINLGLDLLWRAGVKPEKVVLGTGYYGRSFTLTDSACNKPDGICSFSGGAKEGPCSGASGILTLQEIRDIIKEKSLKPVHDLKAGVKWIQWDNDQWVSYDDQDTLKQKKEFANSRCLGGLMVWAIDQVDQKDKSLNYPDELTEEEISEAEWKIQDEEAKGTCYTTECNEKCSTSEYEASQMNGQPGQLSTLDRCSKGEYRRLCCAKGTIMGKCRWRGYRGLGLPCMGGCADGETEVTQNTNHHSDTENQSCTGGLQSYCCVGFKPPINKEQVKDKLKEEAENQAKDKALEIAEGLALEAAATVFCRVAITAALTPLTFIPVVGWIIRLAVQAAVPALAKVCAKGLAKSGKSVFKFKGKDYEVKVDKPLTANKSRAPSTSPTRVSISTCSQSSCATRERRAVRKVLDNYLNPRESYKDKVCDFRVHGQPCQHYSSVMARRPDLSSITCVKALGVGEGTLREVVISYKSNHKTEWVNGWMQSSGINCQRDEWPAAALWQARNRDVWIRFLPGLQNNLAGKLWNNVCPSDISTETVSSPTFLSTTSAARGDRVTSLFRQLLRVHNTVFRLSFTNMPSDPDHGISANKCWPSTLVDDPGFALINEDPWYRSPANSYRRSNTPFYAQPPNAQYIGNKVPQPGWNKRDVGFGDPEDIYIDMGNSSRKPTNQELAEKYGLLKCKDSNCEEELGALGYASLPVLGHTEQMEPCTMDANATPAGTVTVTVTAAPLVNAAPTTPSTLSGPVTTVAGAAESVITETAKYVE